MAKNLINKYVWLVDTIYRALPLHDTQEETERNEAFSIFTLRICPEFDFYQEILSNGEDVEVLEPKWMREEIGDIIHRMWNKYATTHNIIKGQGARSKEQGAREY